MKINKSIIKVCWFGIGITIWLVFLALAVSKYGCPESNFSRFISEISDILFPVLSGICTGFIVTIIVSYATYFNEKEKAITMLKSNIEQSYRIVYIHNKLISNIKEESKSRADFENLKIGKISKSKSYLNDMTHEFSGNLESFELFCKKSQLNRIVEDSGKSLLKMKIMDLQTSDLVNEILSKRNKEVKNDSEQEKITDYLEELTTTGNMLVAELDCLAEELYTFTKQTVPWEEIKKHTDLDTNQWLNSLRLFIELISKE